MFKKSILVSLASISIMASAETNASAPVTNSAPKVVVARQTSDNQNTSFDKNPTADATQNNSPTVNSRLYSGALFPQQNQLTGHKGSKYNASSAQVDSKAPTLDNNNTNDSQQLNSPNVNSKVYSGSQFPEQNQLSGKKHQHYYTKEQRKQQVNNPTINSRLSSANMFPEQDQFNNDGKVIKKSAASSVK
ncbi:MAG: hypothetical protein RLZZ293_1549 [Pseudomonadota bacterium]|jgi:hypothetical protein